MAFACVLITLVGWEMASAQTTAPAIEEGLSLRDALDEVTNVDSGVFGEGGIGDALTVGTALEVATSPFGTASGGFTFVFDPTTGIEVRSARTFGPAFAERAITSGAGKVSIGANFLAATYDKLGDLSLESFQAFKTEVLPDSPNELTGETELALSSQTVVLFGSVGATDDLDISVAVPLVKVVFDGVSTIRDADDQLVSFVEASGRSSGVGDVTLSAKYRFLRFGDREAIPDPGGLGVLVRARLPTGDRDNLRGLGISRTLVSLLFSSGTGRLRPHLNAGYEWWSEGVTLRRGGTSGLTGAPSIIARHLIEYAAGVEVEATPQFTLLFDVLGRHVRGGGVAEPGLLEFTPGTEFRDRFGLTSLSIVGLSAGDLRKISVAPGFKWNVKGNVLLSLNALIPVDDNGLHDEFTPVVGLDWSF